MDPTKNMRRAMASVPNFKRKIRWCGPALFAGLAFGLSQCGTVPPSFYSLDDPEVFVSPQPSPLNVAVAVFHDRRPSEERAWAGRARYPSNLSIEITRRVVDHLRVSAIFGQVEMAADRGNPPSYELSRDLENDPSGDRIRVLASRGFDAVLTGDLVHFHGKTGPGRKIEGHVRFEGLTLYNTHTGHILWQGDIDKLLNREDKGPSRDSVYASEALRGAINQLAMRLSDLSYAPDDAKASRPSKRPDLRLGILLPEDLRPRVETDATVRRDLGDRDYRLYSDTAETAEQGFICELIPICSASSEIKPFAKETAEQLVEHLTKIGLFGEVRLIAMNNASEEELRQWASEGLDLILTSRLTTGWSSVVRPSASRPFPIWSGGMGYPPQLRMTAMVRLDEVRLIHLNSRKVLWSGSASYNTDKMLKGLFPWRSPNRGLEEALQNALQGLANRISREVPRLMEEINASEMGLKTYPDRGE
ncbi:MAG TPA: hypothetical protein VI702_00450 [Nitrospiria bacterium]